MLQAMKEEPPLNSKCKDKFLIQSTLITPDKETLPLNDIVSSRMHIDIQLFTCSQWNVSEGEDANRIHSQKIKVVYLPPEGQAPDEREEEGAHQPAALDLVGLSLISFYCF
jgi:vesicle-associated membrane protein-associated protein A